MFYVQVLILERIIIHSDMNSCYASIECSLNPDLKGKPMAVGGNEASRHGIILAKSEQAKKFGIKTGETLWQARQKCPELIIVEPHYNIYKEYSRKAHEIYARYTDLIEPMGLDEVWCDLTGSITVFGSAHNIIREIMDSFKRELDITVSIGLSFNKIFAKLGSDLAGRDEFYEITKEDYKEKVWRLPVSDLFGIGRKTAQKLEGYGVITIGDLANCSEMWLKKVFGVSGTDMWISANGLNSDKVDRDDYNAPLKSIGHGITCKKNLEDNEEVWKVFLYLSQNVSKRLRAEKMKATGVQISVRDSMFSTKQFQCQLTRETQSAFEIARHATTLFTENYTWKKSVRALTVRAINLIENSYCEQLDFYTDYEKEERQKNIDDTVMSLREKFGDGIIFNCCLMGEDKITGFRADEKAPAPFKAFK